MVRSKLNYELPIPEVSLIDFIVQLDDADIKIPSNIEIHERYDWVAVEQTLETWVYHQDLRPSLVAPTEYSYRFDPNRHMREISRIHPTVKFTWDIFGDYGTHIEVVFKDGWEVTQDAQ